MNYAAKKVIFLAVRNEQWFGFEFYVFNSHWCCFIFPGKILIIGGGIANFTNVAATFKVM